MGDAMLTAVPRHWYSWAFDVRDGDRPIAKIDAPSWKDKGTVTIGEDKYRVYRESMMSGPFLLERRGSVIARAEKPSALRRAFEIRFDERSYELRGTNWGRSFVLLAGSREVGSIRPVSAFRRAARVQLPDQLPQPVRIFILWLALLMWKRDAMS